MNLWIPSQKLPVTKLTPLNPACKVRVVMSILALLETTKRDKSRQHSDFPGGHPPEYYPSLRLLNFTERTGYGVLSLRWPSTSTLAHTKVLMQAQPNKILVCILATFARILGCIFQEFVNKTKVQDLKTLQEFVCISKWVTEVMCNSRHVESAFWKKGITWCHICYDCGGVVCTLNAVGY